MCKHLIVLENDLKAMGVVESYRGQAWSKSSGEWVYFDCQLDLYSLRQKYSLPGFVADHSNVDNKSGLELGFICTKCDDAIMGIHPYFGKDKVKVR